MRLSTTCRRAEVLTSVRRGELAVFCSDLPSLYAEIIGCTEGAR